ncbi:MAG: SPOR domain-containing protein [Candidatus Omnitrophota bacterium]
MSKPYKSYTQFELFPDGTKREYQPSIQNFQSKSVSLLVEHIVGICIIFIVTNVVVFCLGVKKGQVHKNSQTTIEKNVADKNKESAIIVRSGEPKPDELESSLVQEEDIPSGQKSVEVLEIELPKEVMDELKYTIQVASFKEEQSALKEEVNLRKKGYETSIMQKGKYSIVCVGKFSAHQEAKQFSERLKNRYKDCLVRRF